MDSFGSTVTGLGFDKKNAVITPPSKMPPTKKRFHASFFHSYRKKEMSPGKHAAQICRKDEEMPKVLLPKINNKGTVSPISGPATYHGQGCLIHSMKDIVKNLVQN